MTFEQWWATLSPREQNMIGRNNARFIWREACEACAQIAETAEPYQAADLIRARAAMLFDDWDGGFPYKR